jgi:uncharacterized protein YecA (UPF0149 family)
MKGKIMGRFVWRKDYDRGWQLQELDPFEAMRDGEFFITDDVDVHDGRVMKRILQNHPIPPFTDEMRDDLKAYHDID